MFTGIITDVGTIRALEGEGDMRISVNTAYNLAHVSIGASIANDGVCLTVVGKGNGWFMADISEETIRCTTAGSWQVGKELNLERALKLGEEMGGHIVTGHVDCIGEIVSLEPEKDSLKVVIAVPKAFGHLLAAKGSVTVNGVSLTVNAVMDEKDATRFSINFIPHTQKVTNFHSIELGDKVNIEFDVLARYVARLKARND